MPQSPPESTMHVILVLDDQHYNIQVAKCDKVSQLFLIAQQKCQNTKVELISGGRSLRLVKNARVCDVLAPSSRCFIVQTIQPRFKKHAINCMSLPQEQWSFIRAIQGIQHHIIQSAEQVLQNFYSIINSSFSVLLDDAVLVSRIDASDVSDSQHVSSAGEDTAVDSIQTPQIHNISGILDVDDTNSPSDVTMISSS